MLHRETKTTASVSLPAQPPNTTTTSEPTDSVSTNLAWTPQPDQSSIMMTTLIYLKTNEGKKMRVRALIDPDAGATLMLN